MDNFKLWHTLSAEEATQKLKTTHQGLSHDEAGKRYAQYGANTLREGKSRSPWRMLLDQFSEFMILVLIAAAIISGIVGDIEDTIAIIVIITLNAVIGFIQEYRAERSMAALKRMSEATVRVMRENSIHTINASELVLGDAVLLEAGNLISADLRLTESSQLKIDESTLTGESVSVDKQTNSIRIQTHRLAIKLA
jgi:Ca2+-transporting ATPase